MKLWSEFGVLLHSVKSHSSLLIFFTQNKVTSRFSKEADKLKPPPSVQAATSATTSYVLQSPYFDQDSADSGTYDSCVSGGSSRGRSRRSNRGRGGKR